MTAVGPKIGRPLRGEGRSGCTIPTSSLVLAGRVVAAAAAAGGTVAVAVVAAVG